MFLLPGIVSVMMFVLLWANNVLARPGLVGAICVTGIVLQFLFEQFSAQWLAGLLVNVGMAVYLSIRLKLS